MKAVEAASTRSLGLLRIGAAALVWATWGSDLILYRNLVPHELVGAVLLMTVCAAMVLGWWSRTASALTGAGVAYMVLVGDLPKVPFWPDLHVALMVTVPLVLAWSPCGRSLSLDRYLALRRSEARKTPPPAEHGDVRALTVLLTLLIGAHVVQILTMSNTAWLSGYTLERIIAWHALGSVSPGPAMRALIAWLPVVAIGGYLFTCGLVLALIVPATRARAAAVGALAQVLLYALFPASTGPLVFALLYLAALEPGRVHAAIVR